MDEGPFVLVWTFAVILGIAFWITVIYVAFHFIAMWW